MSPDGAIFAVISTLKGQQVCPIQPWSAVLLKPPRECSLNTWLWWLGSWGYIYEPQGSDMKRQALVGYNLQSIAKATVWNTPPVFLWKKAYSLVLGFQVCHTSRSYIVLSLNALIEHRQGNTIFSLSFGLATSPRKELIYLNGAPLFFTSGHLQIMWSRGQQGGLLWWYYRIYIYLHV